MPMHNARFRPVARDDDMERTLCTRARIDLIKATNRKSSERSPDDGADGGDADEDEEVDTLSSAPSSGC